MSAKNPMRQRGHAFVTGHRHRSEAQLPTGVIRPAVGMLRDAWHDVLMLKGSRLEWGELHPAPI